MASRRDAPAHGRQAPVAAGARAAGDGGRAGHQIGASGDAVDGVKALGERDSDRLALTEHDLDARPEQIDRLPRLPKHPQLVSAPLEPSFAPHVIAIDRTAPPRPCASRTARAASSSRARAAPGPQGRLRSLLRLAIKAIPPRCRACSSVSSSRESACATPGRSSPLRIRGSMSPR